MERIKAIMEDLRQRRERCAEADRLRRAILAVEKMAHGLERKADLLDFTGDHSDKIRDQAEHLRLAAACMWARLDELGMP